MNIRQAEAKDKTAVLQILEDFGLEKEFEPEETLLAEVEGEVAGCVRLKILGECYELCSLAVKEEYQGNGIGTKLVEECLASADAPVYCLTFAPEFFGRFDFACVERDALPQELKSRARCCDSQGRSWVAMVRR